MEEEDKQQDEGEEGGIGFNLYASRLLQTRLKRAVDRLRM